MDDINNVGGFGGFGDLGGLSNTDSNAFMESVKNQLKISIGNSYSDCLLIYLLFFNLKVTLSRLVSADTKKDKEKKIEEYVDMILSKWRDNIEDQVSKKLRDSKEDIEKAYAGFTPELVETYVEEVYRTIDDVIESVVEYGRDHLLVKNRGQTYETYMAYKKEKDGQK
jgi:hypothetical protein